MKLLTRTTRYYLLYSLVVLVTGGLLFYPALRNIIYNQLDENLTDEKLIIMETIDHADSVPDFRQVFGHEIEVTIFNTPLKKKESFRDTNIYVREQGEFIKYRHLWVENTSVRNKGYIINIYKPLRESEALILEIYLAITILFASLLLLLVVVNYFVARRAWIPFYKTLGILRGYNINEEAPLSLIDSNIHEFVNLNQALEKMSRKIRKDFINLKEFNENAAHELQTPLAVIKSKIDLLVQDESLTVDQLKLIAAVSDATSRMSKLNQGLLLISKIDNNQFSLSEEIEMETVIDHTTEHFSEIMSLRGISVTKNYSGPLIINMSRALAEILVNNLISNAIKHNIKGGTIDIRVESEGFSISNTGHELNLEPHVLFERFRKSDYHTESVGLGLSIVRKITDLFRLQITYEYTDGMHILKIVK